MRISPEMSESDAKGRTVLNSAVWERSGCSPSAIPQALVRQFSPTVSRGRNPGVPRDFHHDDYARFVKKFQDDRVLPPTAPTSDQEVVPTSLGYMKPPARQQQFSHRHRP
ncbi:hypothetical protein L596_026278 [Steinernema carpocapsae]|uniref:Uncharacterized protein n=1 Tax=Steinernema carpocapsae TaxID=34508 RepID=A0A4U5M0W1_STECR|nr:hypothetical protein L596_026278 [Steinernema carpocapsae]